MIPVSEAIDIIKAKTGALGSETADLAGSVGRVLAEDIIADTDLPPFHRSQMDGFAVKAKDTKNAPISLKIVGESAAGKGWQHELKSGEAVRIMTGAPVPKGADAVQKVELIREVAVTPRIGAAPETDGMVEILESVKEGHFIVSKGFEVKKGEKVFSKGEIITVNNIASLAAFGYSAIEVSLRPKVAILATGSEIVGIDEAPGIDQIRNSNSVMLKALATSCGAEAEMLPIAQDDLKALKSRIDKAAKISDLLIITGGVSVGKYDLTKAALMELGAEIFFEQVRLKPGKPTVFAKLKEALIFGLPGNPVSAAVTFYIFVRMALLQMQNAARTQLTRGFAVLGKDVKAAKERDTYLPARRETNDKGQLIAEPLRWQGSSDFIGFARADCLIFVPKGSNIEAGNSARILFL